MKYVQLKSAMTFKSWVLGEDTSQNLCKRLTSPQSNLIWLKIKIKFVSKFEINCCNREPRFKSHQAL